MGSWKLEVIRKFRWQENAEHRWFANDLLQEWLVI